MLQAAELRWHTQEMPHIQVQTWLQPAGKGSELLSVAAAHLNTGESTPVTVGLSKAPPRSRLLGAAKASNDSREARKPLTTVEQHWAGAAGCLVRGHHCWSMAGEPPLGHLPGGT